MSRRTAARARVCAVTDVGLCRDTNEDDFFLSHDGRLWVVADGIGGGPAGALASALAIGAIAESMAGTIGARAVIAARLLKAFSLAQHRVVTFGLSHDECTGMGTAVLAAWLDGDVAYVCHAGDVRCYVHSAGALEQITRDHAADTGRLEQAVGIFGDLTPQITERRLRAGDRVLVCSDGLWGAMTDDRIRTRLAEPRPIDEIAAALVDDANAAGGGDNVTVIAYEHARSDQRTVFGD
jgi:PPM family protein phosphatase